ncbi:MAG: hypothetical protein ABSH20_26925 [Tepidisphaeraceae bacterium]|jgi:hypothetical protein
MNNEFRDDLSDLSAEDAYLVLVFRERRPKIARHIHCLFRIDSQTLDILKEVVGSPFGVWNGALPDDYLRKPGSPGTEWPLIEGFHLWAEPRNQAIAMQFRDQTDPDRFCMLIDATTQPEFLRRLWASAPPEWGATVDAPRARPRPRPTDRYMEYWGEYLDLLAESIDELKWACVGVYGWSELPYGLFVTDDANAELVSTFMTKLRRAGRDVSKIEWKNGEAFWSGSIDIK